MRKVKEVLRLRFELGLGQRQIAPCDRNCHGTTWEAFNAFLPSVPLRARSGRLVVQLWCLPRQLLLLLLVTLLHLHRLLLMLPLHLLHLLVGSLLLRHPLMLLLLLLR